MPLNDKTNYFLKLSKISFAKSFQPNQNASHQAIQTIATTHLKIVSVIVLATQIWLKTHIRTKKSTIILAQTAIIFAVFCLVNISA
ncbi:MAG: hypothetical protein LBU14_05575 [Candidatus Peribacteria bacterium]|jgi:hypothetical protein|nr:hypothetical protein [Candidatus Peribacteria bacterium]